MKVRKAVIPVAGLGTRMLPATKAIPKELVTVVNRPAVQWVVEAAVASGIEEIVLVTAAGKHAIEDHFDAALPLEQLLDAKGKVELATMLRALRGLARIVSVRQPEPLGLGHAVLMARGAVGNEPFAVILPDELVHGSEPPLAQCLAATDAECVIGLVRVPRGEISRYGIVKASPIDDMTVLVEDMVEKPAPDVAPSDLAITGPYVLTPDVFDDLEQLGRGAGGEVQLTDALRKLVKRRRTVGRLITGERLDIGHPLGFVQANVVMGLEDAAIGAALRTWLRERLGPS